MHNGHITVDGRKMSKSLGNFYTLKDLEEKYSDTNKSVLYRAIRLSFLAGKYRDNIDFSFDKIEANITTISKIDETIKKVDFAIQNSKKQ
jgi:cysteinyl-tRNA synthetase